MPRIMLPTPSSGLRADLSPFEAGQMSLVDSRNILLRDGRFVTRPGHTQFGAGELAGETPNGIIQYDRGDKVVIVMATGTRWWIWDDDNTVWQSLVDPDNGGPPLSGGAHTMFRVLDVGGDAWLIGANGADALYVYKGSGHYMEPLGDNLTDPPTCIAISNGHLVAAIGLELYVSALYDPTAFYVQLIRLAETDGSIIGLQELGSTAFVVYKTDAIYLAGATGNSDEPFDVALKAIGCSGPCSTAAIAANPEDGSHYYLGRDGGVYIFDGTAPRTLGAAVQAFICRTAEPTNLTKSHACYDRGKRNLWIYFPGTESTLCNRALVIQFPAMTCWAQQWQSLRPMCSKQVEVHRALKWRDATGRWCDIDSGISWSDMDKSWVHIMNGCVGLVMIDEGAEDLVGNPIYWFWETGLSNAGIDGFKTVNTVDHLITRGTPNQQTATARIGFSDNGAARSLGAARSIDLAALGRARTSHRQTSQFFSMRLEGTTSDEIEWVGASVEVEQRGLR
jgi:hypothetical protein